MQDIIFHEIESELLLGTTVKEHPFRFFSLASFGLDNTIGLRTIVLREIGPDLKLTFFTDSRSPKMGQLAKNSSVSALFYHPQKQIQLRIEGEAKMETDPDILSKVWDSIPDHAYKDYNTQMPPSSVVSENKEIQYLSGTNNLGVVHIYPNTIDYLKLGAENHTRLQFTWLENEWKGRFLVP